MQGHRHRRLRARRLHHPRHAPRRRRQLQHRRRVPAARPFKWPWQSALATDEDVHAIRQPQERRKGRTTDGSSSSSSGLRSLLRQPLEFG